MWSIHYSLHCPCHMDVCSAALGVQALNYLSSKNLVGSFSSPVSKKTKLTNGYF